jgi:hypothetical protein
MRDADLDRILGQDRPIAPADGFTLRVMAAVRSDVPLRETIQSSPWLAVVASLTAAVVAVPLLPPELIAIPDEAFRPLIMTLVATALAARWSGRAITHR